MQTALLPTLKKTGDLFEALVDLEPFDQVVTDVFGLYLRGARREAGE